MGTLDSLLANIDANPTDKLLWGILTDAMEDIGDSRSVGIRWLITEDKRPQHYPVLYREWTWWGIESFDDPSYITKDENVLPSSVWNKIIPTKVYKDNNDKNFYKLSEALLAAAEAYSLFLKESENVPLEHTTSG